MTLLNIHRDKFLKLNAIEPKRRLERYSAKLYEMLININNSFGSNLVYSQFKKVEGLGVLGVSLKANGYTEIKIEGSEDNPVFSKETIASFQNRNMDKKRFIMFTGGGSPKQRALILNVFNGVYEKIPGSMQTLLRDQFKDERNTRGRLCWVIGITGAGAEGISLKCCRTVHIMEPFWNKVRLEQVKGRAIRICSHKDLPAKDRTVKIFTYYTVFSHEQLTKQKIDQTLITFDKGITSDQNVYDVSVKKDKVNQSILEVMKESAVDCSLNAGENETVQCLRIDGHPDQYLFDPNLEVDKIITSSTFKEEYRAAPKSSGELERLLGAPSAPVAENNIRLGQIRNKDTGMIYFIYEKKGSGGSIAQLFDQSDVELKTAVGELRIDIMTGAMSGLRMYS